MTELTDIELKLRACKQKGCAFYWARQLVQAQWEAGLIPVPHLTNEMFEEIARATVKQLWVKHD
jgi:hypothetical protein